MHGSPTSADAQCPLSGNVYDMDPRRWSRRERVLLLLLLVQGVWLTAQLDLTPRRIRWEDADWGGFADWVEALGTAGALITTAALLSHEIRARRTEQVRRVSAYVDSYGTQGGSGVANYVRGRVHNRSDAPVWQVEGRLRYAKLSGVPTEVVHRIRLIAPTNEPIAMDFQNVPLPEGAGGFDLEIEFTDDENRRWRRRASVLTPLGRAEPGPAYGAPGGA